MQQMFNHPPFIPIVLTTYVAIDPCSYSNLCKVPVVIRELHESEYLYRTACQRHRLHSADAFLIPDLNHPPERGNISKLGCDSRSKQKLNRE